MRILITGGAGFVGRHLLQELRERHDIRVLDNLEAISHGSHPQIDWLDEYDFLKGSLSDRSILNRALQGVEVVINLAALVGIGESFLRPSEYLQTNLAAIALIYEEARKMGVKKIVHASSSSVYGEGRYLCPSCGYVDINLRSESRLQLGQWEPLCPICKRIVESAPTPESWRPSPTSIYAQSKWFSEHTALLLGKTFGIHTTVLRFFLMYGPHQSLHNPYTGIIAVAASRILSGAAPIVFEDGHQSRDFIYVGDAVRAIRIVVEGDQQPGGIYNVGTGRPTTVNQIVCGLINNMGPQIVPSRGQFRSWDIRHCYADISKIASLGFTPRVTLPEGMALTASWLANSPTHNRCEVSGDLARLGLITKQL